jgi:hypothetical protein
MAVTTANSAVLVMDTQLRTLPTADFARLIDGILFFVVVAAGTFAAAPLHVPAAARIWDDMVGIWTFSRSHRINSLVKLPNNKYRYSEHEDNSQTSVSQAFVVSLL